MRIRGLTSGFQNNKDRNSVTFLGFYQVGDRVPLSILCTDVDGLPVLPDRAPGAEVVGADGVVYQTWDLPPTNPKRSPGLFSHTAHLNAPMPVGQYAVRYSWLVAGATRAAVANFELRPGGHQDGAVIAGYAFHRPHAEFLILECDSARLKNLRNPSI